MGSGSPQRSLNERIPFGMLTQILGRRYEWNQRASSGFNGQPDTVIWRGYCAPVRDCFEPFIGTTVASPVKPGCGACGPHLHRISLSATTTTSGKVPCSSQQLNNTGPNAKDFAEQSCRSGHLSQGLC